MYPATDTEKPTDRAAEGKRKGPSFFRHKPIADLLLDGRSREWKRRQEIVAMLSSQFAAGQITDAVQRQIHAAAELLTIAEVARARFLAGEGVSLDDVVRVERAANLAEKRLAQHMRKPVKEDLRDYLARKAA